jgi:hypothetical protein
MNDRKIEALGRPRRSDAEFSRLLALSRGHHFGKVAGVTESLFAYCDGIALLQQASDFPVRCRPGCADAAS